MKFLLVGLAFISNAYAAFIEVDSLIDFQKKLLETKECLVAVGISPCIPCERLKKKLIAEQNQLPDIYYIDLKKYPRIRHVFSFKAVPFVAVYKNGEQFKTLTGEANCQDYIFNIQYLSQQ